MILKPDVCIDDQIDIQKYLHLDRVGQALGLEKIVEFYDFLRDQEI